MSTTIDQRILEMRFDNKQFESNVGTTLSSLDKLKQSLNMTGAAKGLENVSSAAKSVDFSGLANAVQTVQAKFSALSVMAATALANITNSAVNAGKKIVSALTIDPIKTGFSEYETQINAIQTILANTSSKGTKLEQVNDALNILNKYADQTIYNFTEMTRNIGTFTAAGISLDTSVSAIKGIANLAAASGSTSQQASVAMYQLSQALASGTVKLMDWNSVVNAGMGGQMFQDALKETARVHNIAIDDMIKSEGSFRETLQKGWLTSDILTETLNKFTGDLNESQLKTMGYTDEQISGIIKMGKTANDAATKVKTFSQLFDTIKEAVQSGWAQSWQIIVGDFEEAKSFLTEVSNVLGTMIGASADTRNALLKGWKDLGGRAKLIETLKNTFDGLMSIIKPVKEAFKEIFPPLTAKKLLDFTEGLKDLTSKFKIGTETAEKIKSTFKGLFSVIAIGVDFVKSIGSGIITLIKHFTGLGDGILGVTSSFGNWATEIRKSIKEADVFNNTVKKITDFLGKAIDKVKAFISIIKEKIKAHGFEAFLNLMKGIWDVIQKIGNKISDVSSKIADALSNAFRNGDISNGMDILNKGIFAAILIGIKKFIDGLKDTVSGAKTALDNIVKILDGVGGCLEAWQKNIKAGTLLKIAASIGILAASLLIIATIDSEKLLQSMGAITVLFTELLGAMAVFDKIGGKYKSSSKAMGLMIGMSVSILILASSLKMLSSLDWGQLAKGLTGVLGLMAMVVATAKIMSNDKKSEQAITKFAGQMIAMSIAIGMLALSAKLLATFSWEELAKAGTGILGITVTLVAAAKIMDGKDKTITKFAGQMYAMSISVGNFALSAKLLSSLSWEELGKAGAGLFGITTMLVAAAKIMDGKDAAITKFSGQMFVMTIAIGSLALVAKLLSTFSWEELAKAGVGLFGITAMLVATAKIMSSGGSSLVKGAAQMLAMAVSIGVLALALKVISTMSWEGIAKGIVAIAASFGIMGLAAVVLGPLVPTILALSAAIALLGVGCVAIGAGVLALSAGLLALGTVTATTATAIVAALTVIIGGLLNLVPLILQKLGEGIVAFAQAIADGSVSITNAITTVLLAVVEALVRAVPVVVDGLMVLLTAILEALAKYIPKMVVAGMKIIIGLLKGISDNIAEVVATAIEVVVNFIEGIASKIPDVIQAGVDLILSFINGLADAIRNNTPLMIDAIENLCHAIIDSAILVLVASITNIKEIGQKIMNSGFIQGIKDTIGTCIDTVKSIPQKCIEQLKEFIKDFADIGKQLIGGFIKGIKNKIDDVVDAASDLAENAVDSVKKFLKIKSPSRKFAELGMYSVQGFAVGLQKYSNIAAQSAEDVGQNAMISLGKSISNVSDIIENGINSDPVIRPVIDLTNAENGAKRLNQLFSNGNANFSLSNLVDRASSISSEIGSSLVPSPIASKNTFRDPVYSFVQNNYSPKALSRLDIYRQTKNQFSAMKGLVNGT